jgi:hypothetical protein
MKKVLSIAFASLFAVASTAALAQDKRTEMKKEDARPAAKKEEMKKDDGKTVAKKEETKKKEKKGGC